MKLEYQQMVASITYIKALENDEGHFLVCFVLPLCVYFCCFYMWVPVVPLLENIVRITAGNKVVNYFPFNFINSRYFYIENHSLRSRPYVEARTIFCGLSPI